MRRIPLLLVVFGSVLPLTALSASAAPARSAASPPVNSTLPAVSGTARVGQTLTASNGLWGGLTPISYTYQWQRCNSSGSSCGSISRATNQNYVASSGDAGHTIRVEVTATNADGKSQALSAPTGVIAPSGNAPASTKQPNPSGTAQEGQTVTVDNGTWSGLKPMTFGYQWQSCTTGGACTNIAGATKSSFLISQSQVGMLLRAKVVATNSVGSTSAFSNATAVVLAKATAPVNLRPPVISGSPSSGQRLSASTGSWSGVGTSGFSYQWTRCNSNGSACSAISGAIGQSYGVGRADVGSALRVAVTATNPTGSTTSTSAAVQIRAAVIFTARFNAVLRRGQELSRPKGTKTTAAGHFRARVTGKTLRWTLTFSHLTGRPTVARLHRGLRGRNGLGFKVLCRSCRTPVHGTLTLTASQLDAMLRGRTYVNVFTKRNRRGEVRGQVSRVG